jgi:hypothetical protein
MDCSWPTRRRAGGAWKGAGGNREVSPLRIRDTRGDLSGARVEAIPKEGGARGKHGFPLGSAPRASDAPGAPTSEIVEFLRGEVAVS